MKRLIGILVMAVLGLASIQQVGAQPKPIKVDVWDLFGNATYTVGEETPHPVQLGTVLPPGAVLKTGPKSAVDLRVGKEGMLRMTQNSVLRLESLEQTQGTAKGMNVQLTLAEGTVVGNVKKLAPNAKLDIRVANGIASVREGDFRISAEGYLVQLDGLTLFAYIPASGEPTLETLKTPPAVYFSPMEGVRKAPPQLVREVKNQIHARLRVR